MNLVGQGPLSCPSPHGTPPALHMALDAMKEVNFISNHHSAFHLAKTEAQNAIDYTILLYLHFTPEAESDGCNHKQTG